ncbi:hypothetical protein WN944_024215 [Citrus x changshan-huyou]|uniref:Uncharacterized protein n=1 Tax=Citrus x changshan-huyou TaxID=2935761 RepID=A0AAP0LQ74_9ROSI
MQHKNYLKEPADGGENASRTPNSIAVETLIWLPSSYSNAFELDIVNKILDVLLDPGICFGLSGRDSSKVIVRKA